MRLFGPSWKPPFLATAAVLAAATLPPPAEAVIEGMEGKIAFQRMNDSGNYDIWIADARNPQCRDGLDNDGDGLVDHGTDPDATPPPEPLGECANELDRDERELGANDALRPEAPLVLPGLLSANETEPVWADATCLTLSCEGGTPSEVPDEPVTDLEQVLVFVSDREGTRDIWAVDADGAVTPLTTGAADDGSPSLCCRGVPETPHVLAFDRDIAGNRDIYVTHLNTGTSCRLTSDPAPDANPDWSPDGRHIAFERHAGGETQIWVLEVDVESGACEKVAPERQVTANQPPSFEPSWFEWRLAEDNSETQGHRIAFSGPEDRADRNIHYIEQSYELVDPPETPFDGLVPITVATPFDGPSEERGPSWSPRGDGLIFASNRGGGDFDVYFLDEEADTPSLLVGTPDTDTDDLNPAIQPLPVTDNVKAFRICGRACRARRRAQQGQASTASASTTTTTTPDQTVTDDPSSGSDDPCTIRGSGRDQTLRGTRRADVICGLGGDDTIVGFGGDDTLRGGPGRDDLLGMAGPDKLYGEAGRDRLFGGTGPDLLSGGGGVDRSLGGPGADRFLARGGGKDRILGGGGRDTALLDGRDTATEVERRPR